MATRAKEILARIGNMYGSSQILSVVAQVSALAGLFDEAYVTGRQAVAAAKETKELYGEAVAYHYLGEVGYYAGREDVDSIAADFQRALIIAGEIGLRPVAARSHVGLGRLFRRAGREALSRHHFTTGIAMLREMDMRFWLEQVEAELKELEG